MKNYSYENMKNIFEKANQKFLIEQKDLLQKNVSERSWYNHLSNYIKQISKEYDIDDIYNADIEYNKNLGHVKMILDDTDSYKELKIQCDIIFHSRGKVINQDNLICIEIKKFTRPLEEKIKDKNRVRILTKDTYNDDIRLEMDVLPQYVCKYILGIYYEVNIKESKVYIEYYKKGILDDNYELSF